ncbi:uncharacterized protein LOC144120606 isoform X2 [Amblyomma americanum]
MSAAKSCCGWFACAAVAVILFCEGCLLHAEPALIHGLAESLQVSSRDASWPLYVANVASAFVGPVAGFLSKIWPRRLLVAGCLAACLSVACCYVVAGTLTYWTLLAGVAFGASCGATRTASVVIVNSCLRQYRSIGNGFSLSGEAVALYLGSPIVDRLVQEYGVRGAMLVLSGLLLNALVLAFFLSRMSFDTSEGPGQEQPQFTRKRSNLEDKVIMEEPASIPEEDDLSAVAPFSQCSVFATNGNDYKQGKTNLVICVAVIEHRRESDSGSEFRAGRSPSLQSSVCHREKERRFSGDLSLLTQRRSWNYEGLVAKRRKSLLEKWVSSSIECLRANCQPNNVYSKLEEQEVSRSDEGKSLRSAEEDSHESLSAALISSSSSSSSSLNTSTSSGLNSGCGPDGSREEATSVCGSDVADQVPQSGEQSGLPRRGTENSLENGDLAGAELVDNVDGVPVKRRYSRLAQDILLRQMEDKRRRLSARWLRNPRILLLCVASCVMTNSTMIFLTRLADLLRTRDIPTSVDEKVLPMFCLGNLVACLCSGWFTDEGHISVRRAFAVDFFILGASMLIVSLHNSVNTFAVQSLLQGWVFGQTSALTPVLLVETLGVLPCGFAFGVIAFVTALSVLCRQLLIVHFKSLFGTQEFIFNFHGILALAIGCVFLVETRFNRASVRSPQEL